MHINTLFEGERLRVLALTASSEADSDMLQELHGWLMERGITEEENEDGVHNPTGSDARTAEEAHSDQSSERILSAS